MRFAIMIYNFSNYQKISILNYYIANPLQKSSGFVATMLSLCILFLLGVGTLVTVSRYGVLFGARNKIFPNGLISLLLVYQLN